MTFDDARADAQDHADRFGRACTVIQYRDDNPYSLTRGQTVYSWRRGAMTRRPPDWKPYRDSFQIVEVVAPAVQAS